MGLMSTPLPKRHIVPAAIQTVLDSVVVGCCGLAAAGIAGAWSQGLDQVNNLAPQWTMLGLAAGIGSIAMSPRRRPRIAATALLALVGAYLVVPDHVAALTAPTASGPTALRVVSFNAWKSNPQYERAGRWLIGERPDVIVLTEATPRLREMLEREYPYAVSCLPGGACSTVIYSRTRPIDGGGLAKGGDPEARTALSAAWAVIPAVGGPVTVLALHLNHPWPLGDGADQMKEISAFLEGRSKTRMIVAGDLNRTPWSHALAVVDRTLGMTRATHALATWPVGGSIPTLFPIDHVYSGDGLVVGRIGTGPFLGSDHLPVVATVANR